MMRLDKYLCELSIGTRSQVKEYVKQGLVTVNGILQRKPEYKVDEAKDIIAYQNQPCRPYTRFGYFMLNKPAGVVSATKDNLSVSVIELLGDTGFKDLFPVGRLDKDTEGLLLLTNDGELAHNLLSPKKHIPKTYYVKIERPLSGDDIRCLEEGVDIGEEKLTLPAKLTILSDRAITLTITEGKFHQVKRMLQAVGNKVLYLKRMSMGTLFLDENLSPSDYRPLTEQELEDLKHANCQIIADTQ